MALQLSVDLRNRRVDAIEHGTINGGAAAAWVAETEYTALTDWVVNDSGKVYLCTTTGESDTSGGPTGTGTDITDGTAGWTFIGYTGIGFAPKIAIHVGTIPANCAASTTGTKLVEWTLGSDWATDAASGSKSLSSTPLSEVAVGTGNAGYYRVFDAAGTCHMQGTVTVTGGGGDLTVDNIAMASGQTVNITSWAFTDANA